MSPISALKLRFSNLLPHSLKNSSSLQVVRPKFCLNFECYRYVLQVPPISFAMTHLILVSVQITKGFVLRFSPVLKYFVGYRPKYHSEFHFIPKLFNLCFFLQNVTQDQYLSIIITVQRDATQSSLFIILQAHSTCFGCQPHPSPGVNKTVTTTSGTVQLAPSPWPSSLHLGREGGS